MKRRITGILIALSIAVSCIFMMSAGVKNEGVQAEKCFILVEASTGCTISGENSDKQVNCGYLSKLMTLLLIAEDIETGKYSLDTELTASESVKSIKGAVIWLEPGDKITVEELLKGVIIGNANDAVTVLAERSEGDIDSFVSRMNSEAFDLGLRNSAFYSPYGYFDEREHSTASDLAAICCKLAGFDFLRPYFSTWRDFVKNGTVELVNENSLSRTYASHIGFKASHSDQSGYCIAEGAESEDGTRYISVVLGAADEKSAMDSAKELCRKGFREFKVSATLFTDEMTYPVRVKKGVSNSVSILLNNQSSIVIPRFTKEVKTITVLPKFLEAPVRKGQVIGTAAFYDGKTAVFEAEIIASESVERLEYKNALVNLLLNMVK